MTDSAGWIRIAELEAERDALMARLAALPAPAAPQPETGTGGVTALLAAAEGTRGWGEHVLLTRDEVAEWLRGRADEWPTHPWRPAAPQPETGTPEHYIGHNVLPDPPAAPTDGGGKA